ncbi:ankyrin repeat domain-containing protein [bacterium]|nr:MAG: ankyrin repeat domain-containing protein [bacterium]
MNNKFFVSLVMLLVLITNKTPILVASSKNLQGPSNPIILSYESDSDSSDNDSFGDDSDNELQDDNQDLENLSEAALNSDIQTLQDYLYFNPNAIHAQDQDQAGILHRLALRNDAQLSYHEQLAKIQVLVTAGADINAQDFNGDTPLHKAAMNGHYNALQALIDAGANVNIAADSGETPLDTINPNTVRLNEIACRQALINR